MNKRLDELMTMMIDLKRSEIESGRQTAFEKPETSLGLPDETVSQSRISAADTEL